MHGKNRAGLQLEGFYGEHEVAGTNEHDASGGGNHGDGGAGVGGSEHVEGHDVQARDLTRLQGF